MVGSTVRHAVALFALPITCVMGHKYHFDGHKELDQLRHSIFGSRPLKPIHLGGMLYLVIPLIAMAMYKYFAWKEKQIFGKMAQAKQTRNSQMGKQD
jgi:hypothetical protein